MSHVGLKDRVKDYWEVEVCGSRYGTSADRRQYFMEIDRERYRQEPMIHDFARFEEARNQRVLEVGLGTGADFSRWASAGAVAYGRDLTAASVALVRERLETFGLRANVAQGDAENLAEFPDDFFDVYYSWGVLMATPDTERAIAEAYRVLKPGGQLKIMLYHYPSVGCFLVWIAKGLLRLDLRGPRAICLDNVESPGMKVYTVQQARKLVGRYFRRFPIEIRTYLGAGDLLEQKLSHRYQSPIWRLAQRVYPRWLVRHVLGDAFGSEMTIAAVK